MSKNEYIGEVLARLSDNPTAGDLDYFVEAYARVGYLAATAQGRAELAENERRFAEATSYAQARADGAKSASDAERVATRDTNEYRLAEIGARETATKIRNLLLAIEQAINAIKFLSRQTDATVMLPRGR